MGDSGDCTGICVGGRCDGCADIGAGSGDNIVWIGVGNGEGARTGVGDANESEDL